MHFLAKNIAIKIIYRYYKDILTHITKDKYMNLIRILVIALIVYLVIQIFKRWAAGKQSASPSHSEKEKEKQMVKCEVCQLHIPQSDALEKNGHFFCSKEHLDSNQD